MSTKVGNAKRIIDSKNARERWKIVNEISGRNVGRASEIHTIEYKGKEMDDKKEIANALNEFFINVGAPLEQNHNSPQVESQISSSVSELHHNWQ